MTILIFFTSKSSLLLLNLNKKPAVYRKLFQKIVLLHLKIVSKRKKKELRINCMIKTIYSAIVPHLFLQIYTA